MRVPVREDVRFLQAVRQHQRFVGQQFERRALSHELASIQHEHPRAKLHGEFEVVGGDDLRAGEGAQERFELAPAARIEVGGGFVEHEHGRFASQHAGQADAPLFAVAEAVRRAFLEAFQADLLEAGRHQVPQHRAVHAKLARAEGDVFKDGGRDELVVSNF